MPETPDFEKIARECVASVGGILPMDVAYARTIVVEQLRLIWNARGVVWQPIETAPKDVTRVIVGSSRVNPCVGKYETFTDEERAMNGPADNGWYDDANEWISPQPTHWMPLPDPPVENQQAIEIADAGSPSAPDRH